MLNPGQCLGSYEVIALLGSGGMGQVYRAHDSRLQRDIALKVLRSDDPEHRRRFEREALSVASLNHPNIVTIHSVEEAEGFRFSRWSWSRERH
jgi:eukaryotic-like serine/threonine-protein kinase